MSDKKREWTVFFIIKSVDNSIPDAIQMINELREIRYNAAVSVILCMKVAKKNLAAIEAGDPRLIDPNGDPARTTVFYTFTENAPGQHGFVNDLRLVAEEPLFDLTNAASIKAVFKEKILLTHHANRYMLFTWDHGNGYGIFRSDALDLKETPEASLPEDMKLLTPETTMTKRAVIQHQPSGEQDDGILTMDELAYAITCAFGAQKIELMVMLNCYMQTFDTGYALRNSVKYLVAPESYMDFDGYNYTFFFRRLCEDPYQSSVSLAKCMIRSFEMKLYVIPADGMGTKATTALFANDLRYYSAIAACMEQLVPALEPALKDRKPELLMARLCTIPVNSSTYTVDLFHLLDNIKKVLGHKWQQKLMKRLLALRQKMVVAQFVGNHFAGDHVTARPSGFSVFFPYRLKGLPVSAADQFDTFHHSSFTNEKAWNNFVKKFTTP